MARYDERYGERYDRGDAGRRYGVEYDRSYRREGLARRGPGMMSGWYPGVFWGDPMMYGWGLGWGGMMPPYVGPGGWMPRGGTYGPFYDAPYPRQVRPKESPTYGRGGDRELQRGAERRGRRMGPEIAMEETMEWRTPWSYDRPYRKPALRGPRGEG